MTSPPTTEERLSRLEGAFQLFEVMASNMVTREGMQAHIAGLVTAINSVKAEMQTAIAGLRSEMETSGESLRAEMRTSNESMRAELRAEIRAAFQEERADRRAAETRNTRWIIGSIFAAATLIIAATQLLS